MLREIERFDKNHIGTIKSKRYKTFKSLRQDCLQMTITKIIAFDIGQTVDWFDSQIYQRIDVLRSCLSISSLPMNSNFPLEVQYVKTSRKNIFYLTKKFLSGETLTKIVKGKDYMSQILDKKNLKEYIWNIMALLIGGTGFDNIILTLDNLIFEKIGQSTYKPCVNLFSFAGFRLLKERKSIESAQYLEIALFLDQQALNSGNLRRFEFKIRTFAAIILTLAIGRDPAIFLFKDIKMPAVIDIQTAINYHKKVVTPRIEILLNFASVEKAISEFKVSGLFNLIKAAFNQSEQNLDWGMVQARIMKNNKNNSCFERLAKNLWEAEEDWMKRLLQSKGLAVGSNGGSVYLALKISYFLQQLLKSHDWQKLFDERQYSRLSCCMLYRLLRMSSLQKQHILESTIGEWVDMSKRVFRYHFEDKANKRKIYVVPHQLTMLQEYSPLL